MTLNRSLLLCTTLVCGCLFSFSADAQLAIDPYPLEESGFSKPLVREEASSQKQLNNFIEFQNNMRDSKKGRPKERADLSTDFPVYVAPAFESQKAEVVIAKPQQYQLIEQRGPLKPVYNEPVPQEWVAFQGANLQDVIIHWSKKAGVEVIWNSYADYQIKESAEVTGSFEEALQTLLSQFNFDYVRPVANLHINPTDGEKTLIILTYQGT